MSGRKQVIEPKDFEGIIKSAAFALPVALVATAPTDGRHNGDPSVAAVALEARVISAG